MGKQGESLVNALAGKYGISVHTVRLRAKKLGIKFRGGLTAPQKKELEKSLSSVEARGPKGSAKPKTKVQLKAKPAKASKAKPDQTLKAGCVVVKKSVAASVIKNLLKLQQPLENAIALVESLACQAKAIAKPKKAKAPKAAKKDKKASKPKKAPKAKRQIKTKVAQAEAPVQVEEQAAGGNGKGVLNMEVIENVTGEAAANLIEGLAEASAVEAAATVVEEPDSALDLEPKPIG